MNDINKLIVLINDKLKTSKMSLNQVLKNLGYKNINKIKEEITKANYRYDFSKKEYTKVSQQDIKDEVAVTRTHTYKDVNEAIDAISKRKEIQKSYECIGIDINELKELLSLKDELKELIQQYHTCKNIIDVEPVELKVKAVTEVKQRLFKIDIEVLEKWDNFVSDHKEFKVQQLSSLALLEFIEKYSK